MSCLQKQICVLSLVKYYLLVKGQRYSGIDLILTPDY